MCDRRLSRAARAIVHEALLESPAAAATRRTAPSKTDQDDNLWTLLEQILPPLTEDQIQNNTSLCPLYPALDVGRQDELHSMSIPADKFPRTERRTTTGFTAATARRNSAGGSGTFWKSLYTEKIFTSRYYLDQHHHRMRISGDGHGHSTTTTTAERRPPIACPAQDWCNFLAPRACHERAWHDEPYYDRGSGGRRKDKFRIQAKLWKDAHSLPCTTQSAAQARQRCQVVAETCFANLLPDHSVAESMITYWKTTLCQPTKFSCTSRLQQAYFGVQGIWQDQTAVWYSDDHQHALGWTGSTLLLLIGLYYAKTVYRQCRYWYRQRFVSRRTHRLFRMSKAKRH